MTYRVEVTDRAARDLKHIYDIINAADVKQATTWFNGLEKLVLSLDQNPGRGPTIRETNGLRHLLYGRRRNVYRIIYAVDENNRVVTVIHIRHGARDAFVPDMSDD